MKFKVSELFRSLQGEIDVGIPSVFVRLFGCNFKCAGFGMARGKQSVERLDIDPSKFDQYDDLPLVNTGCDSYASWDPRFKNLSKTYLTAELIDGIVKLLPNGRFSKNEHLILTGGEPLLGWQRGFPELLDGLINFGLTNVTFETNGTQSLTGDMFNYIKNSKIQFFFSVSAKLPVSGESYVDAIQPYVVKQYVDSSARVAFKFVVSTQEDIPDIKQAISDYYDAGVDIPVYLMPVGGVDSVYYLNNITVANIALDNGWRYTPRLQVDLWKNAWAT